jgi:hypothetical protein
VTRVHKFPNFKENKNRKVSPYIKPKFAKKQKEWDLRKYL